MPSTKCYQCNIIYEHDGPREVVCVGCKSLLRFSSGLVPATLGYLAGMLIGGSRDGKMLSVLDVLKNACLERVADPTKVLTDLFDIGVSFRDGKWTAEEPVATAFTRNRKEADLTTAWESP